MQCRPERGGVSGFLPGVPDQATKEAEYRERVADLKARIDSCTARVAAEEEQVATAKARPFLTPPCPALRWPPVVLSTPSEARSHEHRRFSLMMTCIDVPAMGVLTSMPLTAGI